MAVIRNIAKRSRKKGPPKDKGPEGAAVGNRPYDPATYANGGTVGHRRYPDSVWHTQQGNRPRGIMPSKREELRQLDRDRAPRGAAVGGRQYDPATYAGGGTVGGHAYPGSPTTHNSRSSNTYQPENRGATGSRGRSRSTNFNIKTVARKRIAGGMKKPANAIGNIRRKSY